MDSGTSRSPLLPPAIRSCRARPSRSGIRGCLGEVRTQWPTGFDRDRKNDNPAVGPRQGPPPSVSATAVDALRARGINDVLTMVGGIVTAEAREELLQIGITGIFGPGSSLAEIVSFIRANTAVRKLEARDE